MPSPLPDHDWSALPPARPASPPGGRVVAVVVPALLAVVLWWIGVRHLAVVVVVVASVVTVATSVSAAARRGFERLARAVGFGVGRVLTVVLLGLVQLVVFTPAALVARILRVDPLDLRTRPGTRWLDRRSTRSWPARLYGDERYRRSARAGGRSPVGSPRWIAGALGVVVVLAAADLGLGALLAGTEDDPVVEPSGEAAAAPAAGRPGFDPAAQDALASQPGAAELMANLVAAGIGERDPFTGWRFPDGTVHESSMVNVRDGVRATSPTPAAGPAVRVWFFGGSTMFGSGQADGATIPSVLVQQLAAAGVAVDATNFGHPAYANWQQVQLLEHALTSNDRPPPDVVVFYDGFNDLTLQTQLGVHDEPTHLFFGLPAEDAAPEPEPETTWEIASSWWADRSALAQAADRLGVVGGEEPAIQVADIDVEPIESIDPVAAADAALDIHRRGRRLVEALGTSYGFEPIFFWQPYLYTREPLTPAEEELVDLPGYDTAVWDPMTARVRAQLGPDVVDLSDALDGVPDPLFWDFVHTNERGAALVAEAMRPRVLAAARAAG